MGFSGFHYVDMPTCQVKSQIRSYLGACEYQRKLRRNVDTILYVCILIIEYVVFTRLHETLLNFSLDYY